MACALFFAASPRHGFYARDAFKFKRFIEVSEASGVYTCDQNVFKMNKRQSSSGISFCVLYSKKKSVLYHHILLVAKLSQASLGHIDVFESRYCRPKFGEDSEQARRPPFSASA